MSDVADIANDLVLETTEARIRALTTQRPASHQTHCEDCGSAIPDARRQRLPWVTTCVPCQTAREQQERHQWMR